MTAAGTRYDPGMLRWRCVASTLWLCLLVGCGGESVSPEELDLGVGEPSEGFVPLVDGQQLLIFPVYVAGSFLDGFFINLRTPPLDPTDPDLEVVVRDGELPIGREVGSYTLVERSDGTGGFLVWQVRVVFAEESCCFLCKEIVVEARLEDANGRRFLGRSRVIPTHSVCPDSEGCCSSADLCERFEAPQVCE